MYVEEEDQLNEHEQDANYRDRAAERRAMEKALAQVVGQRRSQISDSKLTSLMLTGLGYKDRSAADDDTKLDIFNPPAETAEAMLNDKPLIKGLDLELVEQTRSEILKAKQAEVEAKLKLLSQKRSQSAPRIINGIAIPAGVPDPGLYATMYEIGQKHFSKLYPDRLRFKNDLEKLDRMLAGGAKFKTRSCLNYGKGCVSYVYKFSQSDIQNYKNGILPKARPIIITKGSQVKGEVPPSSTGESNSEKSYVIYLLKPLRQLLEDHVKRSRVRSQAGPPAPEEESSVPEQREIVEPTQSEDLEEEEDEPIFPDIKPTFNISKPESCSVSIPAPTPSLPPPVPEEEDNEQDLMLMFGVDIQKKLQKKREMERQAALESEKPAVNPFSLEATSLVPLMSKGTEALITQVKSYAKEAMKRGRNVHEDSTNGDERDSRKKVKGDFDSVLDGDDYLGDNIDALECAVEEDTTYTKEEKQKHYYSKLYAERMGQSPESKEVRLRVQRAMSRSSTDTKKSIDKEWKKISTIIDKRKKENQQT